VKVAIVGASGFVGAEMRKVLAERRFPADEVRLLASRTRGEFKKATPDALKGCDLALFAADADTARRLAPSCEGLVVDNSSAFRMTHPLIVPEINGGEIGDARLLANPNCSTILLAMAVHALPVRRVVVCSYQAVSGAGAAALDELARQEKGEGGGEGSVFPKPIARNVIPWVQGFGDDGYSTEETKVRDELRRILGKPALPVSATCVRVPVERAHAEAVHLELEEELSPADAAERMAATAGVVVHADDFPTPRDVAGKDTVHIGRIRRDRAFTPGLALWCVMDQLRKGAALNAIQIAERALGVRV